MPSPFPNLPPDRRGEVRVLRHTSVALATNPWSDPADRDVYVHVPAGWDGRPLPALLLLAPYAGTGEKLLARGLSEVSMAARLDRLFAEGAPPMFTVMPDVLTTLGGSQYVDSDGLGRYATWLADELPPWVEGRLPVRAWGVAGRSSGGFGALHLALGRPGRFAAVVSHAGDLGFDACYHGDFPAAIRAIHAAGGPSRLVEGFWRKEEPSGGEFAALATLCLAAAYSPDPRQPFPGRLPFDLDTGAPDRDVLAAWDRFDPVHASDAALRELGDLRLLMLDAGDRDEHLLHLGARRLARRLHGLGVAHVHEEFPGGHRGTSHRWDVSLPRIAAAL